MAEQIGLYTYRLQVFRDNVALELGGGPGQFDLSTTVARFVASGEGNPIRHGQRSFKLGDPSINGDFRVGSIRYGRRGIASEIEDGETGDLLFERDSSDDEVIPLHFGFYMPEGERYWVCGTQSYGKSSCATPFNRHLDEYFRDSFGDDVRLTIQKVMPQRIADYEHRIVNSFQLIRRRVPRDVVGNQIGIHGGEVSVRLEIKREGRGGLGPFGEISDYVYENEDRALIFDGIEFESAEVVVKVGQSYRKVGLINASNRSGVIDLSDDIERDLRGYPTPASISREIRRALQDVHFEVRND